MNFKGHLKFAILLSIVVWLLLKAYTPIEIDLSLLWVHYFFFLFGSIAPDKIPTELPGEYSHRHFFHSRRFAKIILFILLPFSIYYGIEKDARWIWATAFLIGYLVHLWCDSLSSPLPH